MGALVRRSADVDGAEGRGDRLDEVRGRHVEPRHRRARPRQSVHADRPGHARRDRGTPAHLARRPGGVSPRGTAADRHRAEGVVRLTSGLEVEPHVWYSRRTIVGRRLTSSHIWVSISLRSARPARRTPPTNQIDASTRRVPGDAIDVRAIATPAAIMIRATDSMAPATHVPYATTDPITSPAFRPNE